MISKFQINISSKILISSRLEGACIMSVLAQVREKLASANNSELSAIENQPALLEMWKRLQELREEMNVAKKAAASQAARPYLELIDIIEKKYAVLLRLSS